MQIITGKIIKAQKVVIYGPEGIGKSTFASRFPNALFIDTEGSTANMDVARTPKATSWIMLRQQIDEIKKDKLCATLIIDTIDWAEQMCVEHILAKYQKSGIEDFGYGNGYVYVKEEFGRFLNQLQEVIDSGINVVLTAHAQMRKFEQPDEMGAYDRYELKLGKKTSSQTSPLVKEWADTVLFCIYKIYSVAVDDKGKKHKAQGGKRVMYTTHHPCWDAKNRYGLSDELPMEYEAIAHCIPIIDTYQGVKNKVNQVNQQTISPVNTPQEGSNTQSSQRGADNNQSTTQTQATERKETTGIPKKLLDLMAVNNVSESDIQDAVTSRGYYPAGTPIANYDPGFIDGVLVAAWDKVCGMVREIKIARGEFVGLNADEIPFN